MSDIKDKIRAEIERLKAKYRKDLIKSTHHGLIAGYKIEAYNELLLFIDSLSEQPVEGLEEEVERFLASEESTTYVLSGKFTTSYKDPKKIASHFAEWGAEHAKGWLLMEESLPEMDEEVIVLADALDLGMVYRIAFGHIVNKEYCQDYNGWNIPGVKFWMPLPKIPEDK